MPYLFSITTGPLNYSHLWSRRLNGHRTSVTLFLSLANEKLFNHEIDWNPSLSIPSFPSLETLSCLETSNGISSSRREWREDLRSSPPLPFSPSSSLLITSPSLHFTSSLQCNTKEKAGRWTLNNSKWEISSLSLSLSISFDLCLWVDYLSGADWRLDHNVVPRWLP